MLRRQPKKKKLSQLLNFERVNERSSTLSSLFEQAGSISNVESSFMEALPEELRPYFKVSGVNGQSLNLVCSSAAIKMRFGMLQNSILQSLRNNPSLRQINQFKIKIRPNIQTIEESRSVPELSDTNSSILLKEAESTEDEKLKAVLLKLARQAKEEL